MKNTKITYSMLWLDKEQNRYGQMSVVVSATGTQRRHLKEEIKTQFREET